MQKPGLGQRLVARIKAKGYGDPDAKFGIKVTEFALDHRYPPGHLYKWIGDVVVPDYETILRLARDLEASPGWLHYGDEALVPKAPRRQGRRTAGSLVIALMGVGAAALGWPTGSVAASPGSLASGPQLANNIGIISYRSMLKKAYSWLVRPLLSSWCPA